MCVLDVIEHIVYSALDGRSWEGVVSILTLCKVLWMAGVGKV
jgi:hypothetical protein